MTNDLSSLKKDEEAVAARPKNLVKTGVEIKNHPSCIRKKQFGHKSEYFKIALFLLFFPLSNHS